jgi:hypothetical protein
MNNALLLHCLKHNDNAADNNRQKRLRVKEEVQNKQS